MQPSGAQAGGEKRSRIEFIDCLRGFALAAICIVHFMEQYLGAAPPAGAGAYSQHGPVDGILEGLSGVLIRGKGFALFSFMFGLSFALQLMRREEGVGKGRFVWRMVILLGIGLTHSLLYRGDILSIYAVLALPLLFFEGLGDRTLLILALVLMLGAPRVIITALQSKPTAEQTEATKKKDEADAVAHFKKSKQGPFLEAMRQNITTGIRGKADFQFGLFSRGYQTFAYFLLGLIAGRRRWFEDLEANTALFRKVVRRCGMLSGAIPALAAGIFFIVKLVSQKETGPGQESSPWMEVFGLTVYDAWNFVLTLLYIAGFALLFRRPWWNGLLSKLGPYGRMALTNYVGQSVVGGLVFFSFGLGKLGEIGNAVTLPIALGVIALQMVLSSFWLARFRFGPLEWMWRCLTKMKLEPMMRKI